MDYLCFDIETIPGNPPFDECFVKYGNLKDDKKRKAKLDEFKTAWEEGPQANPDLAKMMSTDLTMCRVCNVSFYNRKTEEMTSHTLNDADVEEEYHLIFDVWEKIRVAYMNRIPLVSFNGISFDLPILRFRAMVLDVPVSPIMYVALTKKYQYEHHHYDLMQELAGWDRSQWKPLNYYLKVFGIEEKSGDGSQVYDLWRQGKIEELSSYCEDDVKKTGQLFQRVKSWFVEEGVEDDGTDDNRG